MALPTRLFSYSPCNATELNWHGLVSDDLTNGQAVMHYSRHHLTASETYVTMLTYSSTNDKWPRPACPLFSSSKTEPCQFQFRSIQFSCVALYAPLYSLSCSIILLTCCNNKQVLQDTWTAGQNIVCEYRTICLPVCFACCCFVAVL